MREADRPKVALLEARMSSELARLVEKHGGAPLCVPAVQEVPQLSSELANELIDQLAAKKYELVVFMTGVAVSLIFERAEQLGRSAELVAALKAITTACRGPKPTAALRGFGVPPTLNAKEPFTAAELLDALAELDLTSRRVLLFHYGERSETLAETLLARRADLIELWLYRWLMPADTSGLERLVRQIVGGAVDALAITCQIQFRHLYQVAEQVGLEHQLVEALNDSVTVAAVGPTCAAVLRAHGVLARVMPEHPKMGPLVVSLMRQLDARGPSSQGGAGQLPVLTH